MWRVGRSWERGPFMHSNRREDRDIYVDPTSLVLKLTADVSYSQ